LKHLCTAAPALVTQTLRRLAEQSPPSVGPGAVLGALGSIRDFGLPLSQNNVRVLLDVCMQHGDAKTAHEFITQFSGDGITPANVRMALRIFSATGSKAAAQDAIEILRDFGETILEYDYDMLLAAFASAGDTEAIIATGRAMGSRGFAMKPGFYNAVIKSCVKNRDHIRALHYFDEMRKLKIPANRYTWGSIIQSAVAHGDMAEAEALLRDLIDTAPKHLCAHAFNHVMQGYALRGDADAALRWFGVMKGGNSGSSVSGSSSRVKSDGVPLISPDAHSYSIILRVASERNDKASIADIVRAMLSERIPLNHSTWRMATAPFGRQLDCAGLRALIGELVYLNNILILIFF
jgi:pentatricopeptide repeat protein